MRARIKYLKTQWFCRYSQLPISAILSSEHGLYVACGVQRTNCDRSIALIKQGYTGDSTEYWAL